MAQKAERKHCPQCGDEYQPDVEFCAECGVPLAWGDSPFFMPMPATETDAEFVVVARDLTEYEAWFLIDVLRREGIPSYVSGESTATFRVFWSSDSRMWVPEDREADARRIIDETLAALESSDIPEDEAGPWDDDPPPDDAVAVDSGDDDSDGTL